MKGNSISPLAIVAIAAVVCFLEPVVHEGIGHGIAAVALGAHLQHVSSVDMLADQSSLPQWAVRVVAAAGIVSNVAFGLLSLVLFSKLRGASPNVRYFLWLFGHSNLFVGSGYMLALSFSSFGDIAEIVNGLSWKFAAQLGLTAVGAVIALATYVHAARTLEEFLGREDRRRRALMITVLPYAAIGVINTLAGALNPEGPMLILLSAAAASFGGNMPMAWLSYAVIRPRATTPEMAATPVANATWIALALVSLVLLFAVLAPGVPR
jgi:hypothetical protein